MGHFLLIAPKSVSVFNHQVSKLLKIK